MCIRDSCRSVWMSNERMLREVILLDQAQHEVLWQEAKIISNEKKWYERSLKESDYVVANNNCISQVTSEIWNIWVPFVKHLSCWIALAVCTISVFVAYFHFYYKRVKLVASLSQWDVYKRQRKCSKPECKLALALI